MELKEQIERIFSRYDPENDAGKVTWCDMALLEIIKQLAEKVEALESERDAKERFEEMKFNVALYR